MVEQVEDLEQLQAEQDPMIFRRMFKHPSEAPRTKVTSTPLQQPPIIVREGTIQIGSRHESNTQGR